MNSRKTSFMYWVFMAVISFGFLSEAWERLSGPTYSEFPGQAVLTFNAAGTGAGAAILLASCVYLARRGGLSAPVLRTLGQQIAAATVIFLPIGYGVCGLGYLAGLLPSWLGALAHLLSLASLGLLLLMSCYLKNRPRQSVS